MQPSSDDDLLLIAAPEQLDRELGIVRPEPELGAQPARLAGLASRPEQREQPPLRRHGIEKEILAHGKVRHDGFAHTVRADDIEAEAIASRGSRAAIACPSSTMRPLVVGVTEQRPAYRFLPRAPQPDESDDFAGVEGATERPDRFDHERVEFEPRRTLTSAGRRKICDGSRPTMSRIVSSGVVG